MSRNFQQKGANRPPRRVYVARTLVEPQAEVNDFLNAVARHVVRRIGGKALVSTIGALHITLLESAGTTPAFRLRGFSPQDVHRFSAELQQYLGNIEGTRNGITVQVDPDRPLRWFGWQANQLALNVLPNTALRQEREHIETFLRERFGVVPELRVLDEHVVFGAFNANAISREDRRDPVALLPEGVIVPDQLALNGLMVFLNGIGDSATMPIERA